MAQIEQVKEIKELAKAVELSQRFDHVPNVSTFEMLSRIYPDLVDMPRSLLETYGGKSKEDMLDILLAAAEKL